LLCTGDFLGQVAKKVDENYIVTDFWLRLLGYESAGLPAANVSLAGSGALDSLRGEETGAVWRGNMSLSALAAQR
jgi:hypothetical protein